MTTKLTLQDYQRISAYLDNALSSKDRIEFEKHLKIEPELKQVLLEFSYSRRLLRSLPVRKAPRNFILRASEVHARSPRFFLVPALNSIAVAAVLLLAVVFGGSQLIPGFLGSRTMLQSASPMTVSAPESNATAESSPMIITWGQNNGSNSATGKGGMGGGGSENLGTNTLYGGGAAAPDTVVVSTPEAGVNALSTAPQITQSPDSSDMILGVAPEADQGKVISPVENMQPAEQQTGPNLTMIEIGLGALAVICAVVAFLLRKTR